jgi:flagellar M-ring protein FliF
MLLASFWRQLDTRGRVAVGIMALVIVAAAVAGAAWVLAPRYQVLFSDLAPEDAAVMTAELDRMKTPYKLGDDGASILVSAETVHKTRLKLLSKNLPLHGAVGFELFNGADFGMTDFAQKVNYQRALQGEITRTILSIDGIQSARVLLALPEQQLFKKRDSDPKASINLVLKPGVTLTHDQVNGIARLVSAAVPDIALQNVTIVDQHGIALTGSAGANGEHDEGGSGSAALDLKKSTEAYLARKLNDVLGQTFGAGKAIARVDVTLDMNRVQNTREELLPSTKDGAAGVLVRERSEGDGGGSVALPPLPGSGVVAGAAPGSSERHEREYQVGRDVKQTVSTPGAVRRIAIAAIVNDTLDASQVAHLKEVLAATVGYDATRGDTIAVYPFAQLTPLGQTRAAADAPALGGVTDQPAVASLPASAMRTDGRESASRGPHWLAAAPAWLLGTIAAGVALLVVCAGFVVSGRKPQPGRDAQPLDEAQRAALLSDMERWLAQEPLQGTPR